MKILAIETSCDETALSILNMQGNTSSLKNPQLQGKVLASAISSQIKIHQEYGGVFPALAKREHLKNLPILFEKVIKKSKTPIKKIDLIVVTKGPGLEPALWTGIVFAKELEQKYNIPVLPVNHMEGHIFSVFAKNQGVFTLPKIKFPILSLLVSGGHTELVLIKDWQKYQILGETLDDAVGEAFDKVARMMNLPYPGGPEISKLAEAGRKSLAENFRAEKINILSESIKFPRPMMHTKNFDFSFSGLKTAVLYLIRKIGELDEDTKKSIALEFENAAIEVLVYKTKKAVEKYNIETLVVAGGVSANKYLRLEIKKNFKSKYFKIYFPERKLTGDNSVMIAVAGYMQYLKQKGKVNKRNNIKAEGNLKLK